MNVTIRDVVDFFLKPVWWLDVPQYWSYSTDAGHCSAISVAIRSILMGIATTHPMASGIQRRPTQQLVIGVGMIQPHLKNSLFIRTCVIQ